MGRAFTCLPEYLALCGLPFWNFFLTSISSCVNFPDICWHPCPSKTRDGALATGEIVGRSQHPSCAHMSPHRAGGASDVSGGLVCGFLALDPQDRACVLVEPSAGLDSEHEQQGVLWRVPLALTWGSPPFVLHPNCLDYWWFLSSHSSPCPRFPPLFC